MLFFSEKVEEFGTVFLEESHNHNVRFGLAIYMRTNPATGVPPVLRDQRRNDHLAVQSRTRRPRTSGPGRRQ